MNQRTLDAMIELLNVAAPEVQWTGRLREAPSEVVTLADVAASDPAPDDGATRTQPHVAAIGEGVGDFVADAPEPVSETPNTDAAAAPECGYCDKAKATGAESCTACGRVFA